MASNSDSTKATTIDSSNPTNKNLFNIDFSFLGRTTFTRKKKSDQNFSDIPNEINVKVYSLRLNHLFKPQNKRTKNLIKQDLKLKRMRDLIHAVSALYDNCLPDIGASSIYDCICAPKAFTICILKESPTKLNPNEQVDDIESNYDSSDCLSTVEETRNEELSIFHDVFSDMERKNAETDDDDDDEDESGDDDDFTVGVETFLKQNSKSFAPNVNGGEFNKIALLDNLIGCATLQRVNTFQLPGQEEWIVDLQLMCVRKMFRGFNIGKYLLSLIQNRGYVGAFDAIVTSSDVYATNFYEKYGFTNDSILNSKYANIGDIWTNTTKMCYIPPYCVVSDKKGPFVQPIETVVDIHGEIDFSCQESKESRELSGFDDDGSSFINELTNMEKEYKKWQKIMFSSYQYQAQLFNKFKQEIIFLKAKLCAKDGIIDDLTLQNNLLTRKNKFLKIQLDKFIDESSGGSGKEGDDANDENEISKLIDQLEIINKSN